MVKSYSSESRPSAKDYHVPADTPEFTDANLKKT